MHFLIFSNIFAVTLLSVSGTAGKNVAVRDRRLVGGKNTLISFYYYYASIEYRRENICGGAIISSRFVVTAAHCEEEHIPLLLVRVGSEQTRSGALYNVDRFIKHDNYTAHPRDGNDIALIQLRGSIEFDSFLQPIEMFNASEMIVRSDMADIVSMGSHQLQQISLPIFDRQLCMTNYYDYTPNHTFCVGEPKTNLCYGDSGAPVAVGSRLAGIVSYGTFCNETPGIVTEIAPYRHWISSVVHF